MATPSPCVITVCGKKCRLAIEQVSPGDYAICADFLDGCGRFPIESYPTPEDAADHWANGFEIVEPGLLMLITEAAIACGAARLAPENAESGR